MVGFLVFTFLSCLEYLKEDSGQCSRNLRKINTPFFCISRFYQERYSTQPQDRNKKKDSIFTLCNLCMFKRVIKGQIFIIVVPFFVRQRNWFFTFECCCFYLSSVSSLSRGSLLHWGFVYSSMGTKMKGIYKYISNIFGNCIFFPLSQKKLIFLS